MEVDFTAQEAVEALPDELARDGTVFALAWVKQDLLVRLKAFGLAAKIGQDRLFPTLPTAVAAYQRWAAEQDQRQARNEANPAGLPEARPGQPAAGITPPTRAFYLMTRKDQDPAEGAGKRKLRLREPRERDRHLAETSPAGHEDGGSIVLGLRDLRPSLPLGTTGDGTG